jgi:hypothetical protein
MFFTVPVLPMDLQEEKRILLLTGCDSQSVSTLLTFASKYRQGISQDNVQKNRKLGTRSLVRIARRLAALPTEVDLKGLLSQTLLVDFLPPSERMTLDNLFTECDIRERELMVRISDRQEGHGYNMCPVLS